jgi:hypothetical protein
VTHPRAESNYISKEETFPQYSVLILLMAIIIIITTDFNAEETLVPRYL